MDETQPSENKDQGLNKIDLSQLQGFSFGTQWTQDATSGKSGFNRDSRSDDRPRRDHGDAKRDRRGFKRPPMGGGGPSSAEGEQHREGERPRRFDRGQAGRGPRQSGGGHRQGGNRHGGQHDGRQPREAGPYISPYFEVTLYPDDTGFTALSKAVRTSCRTYELFDIAKVIIDKNDRFVAVVNRKPQKEAPTDGTPGVKAAPVYISVPDGMPFDTEDAAISHVLSVHIGQFFDTAEVEVDPPKGSFQVINRCTITGELLAPPNYHLYNQILNQHHAEKIRMPIDAYKAKIETVRDPELINQWLEKMKKVTRYTWKVGTAPAVAAPATAADGEVAESTEVEAPAAITFDSLDEARLHLLTHAREKVVRSSETIRFSGRLLEQMPDGEIRRAVEGHLERQRRFPLDTANALRGRLRREGFTIFKKGSKGISYVCAVKRKFRVPGQTFADTIDALISFIESNPMVKASELPQKFLKIELPAKPVDGEAPAEVTLSAEDQQRLTRMQADLSWLVHEGYVTEFIDGRLYAAPAMVEARKKEIESSDHDTENFPDAPAEEPAEVSSTVEKTQDANESATESDVSEPVANETESSEEEPRADATSAS